MTENRRINNRPNILLITTDQHHFSIIGSQNSKVKTPNLDRLHREGILFNRAYCPNPTCTPTRASIITGMYPSQHGAWSLGTKLLEGVPTVGDEFQKHGYRTSLIGKAHFEPTRETEEFSSLESIPLLNELEFWKKFSGPYFGFEHIELARNHTDEGLVGEHYALWMEEKGFFTWKNCFEEPGGNKKRRKSLKVNHCWDIPEEYHYNTWIAERTNAKLDEHKLHGENFFLWASFLDPHYPQMVPEPWCSMYDPDEIDVPEVTRGEHRDSPPQTRWAQCKLEPKQPIRNLFRLIRAGINLKRFSYTYQRDFKKHGVPIFGFHGFHPHVYRKKVLKNQIATYYGMVSMLDKYIGRILDKLDELGLSDNTIVVFTTDHGDFFGQHGLLFKAGFQYEDLIKVPFIVRYPKLVPKNRRSEAIQSLVDLSPTFLSLCNIPIPPIMSGIDQSSTWMNPDQPSRKSAFCEHRHSPTSVHMKTYINNRYKLTIYYNQTYGELYDLQEDPGEIRNLWNVPDSQSLKSQIITEFVRDQIVTNLNS